LDFTLRAHQLPGFAPAARASSPLGDFARRDRGHGTYHRGQVATLLRQLGRKAASTDYLRFIDAQRG